MRTKRSAVPGAFISLPGAFLSVPAAFLALLTLFSASPERSAAQTVLVEAKTAAGAEVATIRTDSMRLAVPLRLLVGGLLFPDGTLQTTAAVTTPSVTSGDIVDGTIVNADISPTAGIADTKLATIQTAGKVTNSATTAMSSSVPSAIVARDAAGGFGASYIAVGDSLRIRGEGSFLATGAYEYGTAVPPPISGPGTRMMWYPEKAAFRAGRVDAGGQWDGQNIGDYSAAFGVSTEASGTFAFASGWATRASAEGTTAMGYGSTANGPYSTALGYRTIASSLYAVALGNQTTAGGDAATAMGTLATANGNMSVAAGMGVTSQAFESFVVGAYNVVEGTVGAWIATEPLFVVGNGSGDGSRSNALTLYKNGNLTIAGSLTENSDARLKEGIRPLEGTLGRILKLTPIRYRFRAGTGHPAGPRIGLAAQDVEPLFPELVARDGEGYLSLSYANLSAVLVRAIQEQQAQIGPMGARIEEHRTQIGMLQAQAEALRDQAAKLQARNGQLESELAALRASQSEILRRLQALEDGASSGAGQAQRITGGAGR
jgi:hypothetical protein